MFYKMYTIQENMADVVKKNKSPCWETHKQANQ